MAEERVRRRLAAILAADVVGYSRMMGADETGTLARLKTLRAEILDPKVAEYDGRIVKTTGDGALIEFASAVEAVRHAVDVQNGLAAMNEDLPEGQRIRLRIGVNVGDIIIDGDDIFGDGVNVAARLEGVCSPGDIYVAASVYDQIRGKIDLPLEDLGEKTLKNIDRPVRTFRIALTVGEPPLAPAEPDRPSIAILPFDYFPKDGEQEAFANGMTEDLTTDLSKVAGLFVVARNSAQAIMKETQDLKQVGARLGVRYLLEGSVRKAGARTRINAQLIEAGTGGHIWADRFDGAIEDVFELQDEVGARVVEALSVELSQSEKRRLKAVHTENLEAYELFVKAKATPYPPVPPRINAAREMFEQVIKLDPAFAGGHAGAAQMTAFSAIWVHQNAAEAGARAEKLARAAIALDKDFAMSYSALGIALVLQQRYAEALKAARQAVERQPSDADGYTFLGLVTMLSGDAGGGATHAEQAIRLSPHFFAGPNLNLLGQSRTLNEDFEAALEALNENVAHQGPVGPPALCSFIASHVGLGDMEAARAMTAKMLGGWPDFRLAHYPFLNLLRDADVAARYRERLVAAGVPE